MVEPAQETGVSCRECWARREWYREYIGEQSPKDYWVVAACEGEHRLRERLNGRPKTFYMDEQCMSSEIPRKNLRFSLIQSKFNVSAKCCCEEGSSLIGHISRNS